MLRRVASEGVYRCAVRVAARCSAEHAPRPAGPAPRATRANCGGHEYHCRRTDRPRLRDENQGRHLPALDSDVGSWLIAVADGFGGHDRGAQADKAAVACLSDHCETVEELQEAFADSQRRVQAQRVRAAPRGRAPGWGRGGTDTRTRPERISNMSTQRGEAHSTNTTTPSHATTRPPQVKNAQHRQPRTTPLQHSNRNHCRPATGTRPRTVTHLPEPTRQASPGTTHKSSRATRGKERGKSRRTIL